MTKSEKNELKKDLSQDNDLDKKEEEIKKLAFSNFQS